MPQMSPLPWLVLMIMFIASLMIITFHMNHSHLQKLPSSLTKLTLKTKTWLW